MTAWFRPLVLDQVHKYVINACNTCCQTNEFVAKDLGSEHYVRSYSGTLVERHRKSDGRRLNPNVWIMRTYIIAAGDAAHIAGHSISSALRHYRHIPQKRLDQLCGSSVQRSVPSLLHHMALTEGVCTEWRQAVAPVDEAVADFRLHRLVAVTGTVDTGEIRPWWAVLNGRGVTDAAVIALANGCPGLSSANLGRCYNLTDAAIIALANGCPALSTVNLRCCSNLTDASIIALATGCPRLSSVHLYYCSKVTAEAQAAMQAICCNVTIYG